MAEDGTEGPGVDAVTHDLRRHYASILIDERARTVVQRARDDPAERSAGRRDLLALCTL